MGNYISKTVEQFKIGDGIRLYGWEGTVTDINHCMSTADKDGYCTTNPKYIAITVPCTYLKVSFNEPSKVGYQYDGGWYGGKDGVVAYGCYVGKIWKITFDSVRQHGQYLATKIKRYVRTDDRTQAREKAIAYLEQQKKSGEWESGYIFMIEETTDFRNVNSLIL